MHSINTLRFPEASWPRAYHFGFEPRDQNVGKASKSKQIKEKDWNANKQEIVRLYKEEEEELTKVIASLLMVLLRLLCSSRPSTHLALQSIDLFHTLLSMLRRRATKVELLALGLVSSSSSYVSS